MATLNTQNIYQNGSVGVGFTSATASTDKLDVNGTARIRTLPAGSYTELIIVTDANGQLHKAPININSLIQPDDTDWKLLGNAGTDPNINFVGTTDAAPLKFRAQNIPFGHLSASIGQIKFGIGSLPSTSATSGYVLIGSNAGVSTTGTSDIIGIGSGAFQVSVNPFESLAIGNLAGANTSSLGASVAVGNAALRSSTNVNQSVAVGQNALGAVDNATNVVGIGTGAGNSADGSSESIFIGNNAGYLSNNASKSIYIGHYAGSDNLFPGSSKNNQIAIGERARGGGFTPSIALGDYATNTANNQLMIGSTTSPINLVEVKGTGAIAVPSGTTAERPAAPIFGQVRYNATIGRGEMYVNDFDANGVLGDAGWRAF